MPKKVQKPQIYIIVVILAIFLSSILGGRVLLPILIFGFLFAPQIEKALRQAQEKKGKMGYYEGKSVEEGKFEEKKAPGSGSGFDFEKLLNFKIPIRFNPNNMMKKVWLGIGAVVVLLVLISAIKVIPAGNTGVLHLFGKVNETELKSGFHLINPLAQVEKMNIQTQEYTMSIAQGEGKRFGSDAIASLTKEGLSVDLDLTVLFRLDESSASDVYKDIGVEYEEKLIRPTVRSVIRAITANYVAADIYSEKRTEVATGILEKTKADLEDRGIIVEDVLLRNVALPQRISDSISEKLAAEQESQRYDFVLEKETKEADRKRIEAAGQRDAQQIIAEGLTQSYLQYLYLQNLKDLDGTIYVPTNPNSGVPLFRGL